MLLDLQYSPALVCGYCGGGLVWKGAKCINTTVSEILPFSPEADFVNMLALTCKIKLLRLCLSIVVTTVWN